MCKVTFGACVKQIGSGLRVCCAESTLCSLLAHTMMVFAGRGETHDNSLFSSETGRASRLRDTQPTPGARACTSVSCQPILRCARPCPGQIRDAACRRARKPLRPKRSPYVWLFATNLVSGRVESRQVRYPWPAATTGKKKLTAALDAPLLQQAYEQFREQALGTDRLIWDHGLSVLLSQGLAAWLHCPDKTVSHLEELTTQMPVPRHELVFALAGLVVGGLTDAEVHHGWQH